MPLWLLVTKRVASFEELERSWTLNDVMKALAVLEYQRDLEAKAQEAANRDRS